MRQLMTFEGNFAWPNLQGSFEHSKLIIRQISIEKILMWTLVSAEGLKSGPYTNRIQNLVTLDDLFK